MLVACCLSLMIVACACNLFFYLRLLVCLRLWGLFRYGLYSNGYGNDDTDEDGNPYPLVNCKDLSQQECQEAYWCVMCVVWGVFSLPRGYTHVLFIHSLLHHPHFIHSLLHHSHFIHYFITHASTHYFITHTSTHFITHTSSTHYFITHT